MRVRFSRDNSNPRGDFVFAANPNAGLGEITGVGDEMDRPYKFSRSCVDPLQHRLKLFLVGAGLHCIGSHDQ